MSRLTKGNQRGFTIVELLIATSVLSVILLVVTIMITAIGNLYYKDINDARVQDAVRSITSDLSQHLQLSSTTITQGTTGGIGVICIGNTRYTYVIGKNIGTGSANSQHVLWRDTITGCQPSNPAQLSATDPDATTGVTNPGDAGSGSELIPPNSRLTALTVTDNGAGGSPFTISVGIAYGDTNATTPGTTTGSGISTVCSGQTGDQFCATASLTTTVIQRITGSN